MTEWGKFLSCKFFFFQTPVERDRLSWLDGLSASVCGAGKMPEAIKLTTCIHMVGRCKTNWSHRKNFIILPSTLKIYGIDSFSGISSNFICSHCFKVKAEVWRTYASLEILPISPTITPVTDALCPQKINKADCVLRSSLAHTEHVL